MAGDENVIETDVVKIVPDLTGFRTDLKAKLKSAMDKPKPITAAVRLVADKTGFLASMREELKKVANPNFKVKLVADITGFTASAKTKLSAANAPSFKVKVVPDLDHFEAELRAKLAAMPTPEVKVKVTFDTPNLPPILGGGRGRRGGNNSFGDLFDTPRIIDWGGEGIRPMNLLWGAVVALTPALFAMASNATLAASSLSALGSAGLGAALGIGGLVVAFQGLGDVLKLRQQVKNEALLAGANGAKGAADLAAKADRVADALGSYRTALREEQQAARGVHEARVEAARDLENLRQRVVDLNNEYKRNTLDVSEAQANERNTNLNFFATAAERARAHQDTLDAKTRLGDTALQRRQTQQDLRESIKKGVANADKVIRAQDAYADAKRRRQRAGHALQNARTGADVAAIGKTTSAAAQLEQKLKDMAPAARDIYYWFDRNQETLKQMQRGIAQKVLPGFYKFLREISKNHVGGGKSSLQMFADAMGDLGKIAGDTVGRIGHFLNTPLFRKGFAKMQKNNADAFKTLGDAAVTFLRPLTRIFAAASPLLPKMADGLAKLGDRFDKWIGKAQKNGSLAKWFDDAYEAGKKWMGIVGNLLTFLGNLFKFSLPGGNSLVDKFLAFTKSIADWSGSPEGKKAISDFFDKISKLPFGKIRDFFVQGAALFLAFRTVRWAAANPFLTALGIFAASHPQQAIEFMSALTQMVVKITDWVTKHPNETAFLLTLFAAIKAGKALKLVIDAGGLTGLKNSAMSTGVTAAVLYGAQLGWEEFEKGFTFNPGKDKIHGWGEFFKNGFDPFQFYQVFKDMSIMTLLGLTLNKHGDELKRFFSMDLPNWLSGYSDGWAGVGRWFADQGGPMGTGLLFGMLDGLTGGWLGWGIQKVTGWCNDVIDWFKDLFGIHSPSTVFAEMGADLVKGLWNGFTDFWGGLWTTVSTWVNDHIIDPLAEKFTTGGQKIVDGFVSVFGTMTSALAGPVRAVFSWIDTNFIGKLNTVLSTLGVPQIPVLGSAVDAGKGIGSVIGGVGAIINRADGGPVPGFSPHARADNIPALLTAKEYVQPVDAVQHYGVGFMESVRRKEFPRFAGGGLVGGLIPSVGNNIFARMSAAALGRAGTSFANIANNLAFAPIGGGTASGDVGVAELAEATARSMGASTKELIALISAGLVESGLRNLRYGDRDSLGFLQQRPSQGWGTPAQILDVAYATRKFITAARRVHDKSLSPGDLAQAVQRSATPHAYGLREADAVAVLNRNRPFLAGYEPDAPGTGGGASRSALVAFGRWLQQMGYSVSEHPAFGGVHGGHVPNSWHYRAGAIDVNRGAGTSAREQAYLRQIIPEARRRGLHSIFMSKGHYDHAHFDIGKFDNGGVLPPGFTLAYNGTGKNETIRTHEQEKALSGPIRLDRRDIALLANALTTGVITMDGRKVAETTNRYNYLPAGV